MAGPDDTLPAALRARNFRRFSSVETEYRLALSRRSSAFVQELVRRITEEGWGPLGMWRDMQANLERERRGEA